MCAACDSAMADSPDPADLSPADCIWVATVFAAMLMMVAII